MSNERREYRPDHSTRPLTVVVFALLVTVASRAGSPAGTASPVADSQQIVTCAFSDPAYSGLCKQRVPLPKDTTADQACLSILCCLNNTQCIETCCNATTIRGGWRLESAKVEPSKK